MLLKTFMKEIKNKIDSRTRELEAEAQKERITLSSDKSDQICRNVKESYHIFPTVIL